MHQKKLPSVADARDLKGKCVLVRSSLNIPIKNGEVANNYRVTRALPTLFHLIKSGAKIVLLTHVGRDPSITLEPLYTALREHIDVSYVPAIVGTQVEDALTGLENGKVILLENLRSHEGEVVNDPEFARTLASYGDIYVNDAFADSHREHASIVGIPKHCEGYFGLTFIEEYEELSKARMPEQPSLCILGGAKFETKQPLVEKFIEKYDHVFIGGALANDFFHAKGYEVGTSLVSDFDLADSPLLMHKKILLPVDVAVNGADGMRVTTPHDVKGDEAIVDAGPETMEMLKKYTSDAKTILWNGPLGSYENGFSAYTIQCAELIAESDAFSIVGGGDTVAAIESLAMNDTVGFLSTAGGAMLSFLEKGTLPGIEAIEHATYDRS